MSVLALLRSVKKWEKDNPGHCILIAVVKVVDESNETTLYDSLTDDEYITTIAAIDDSRHRMYSTFLGDVEEELDNT